MSMQKGGLGRGLSSLIPNKLSQDSTASVAPLAAVLEDTDERVRKIKLADIVANPHQPREHFAYDELEDLVNSIKKHGILQPLIVIPGKNNSPRFAGEAGKFQLIAGERRFRAATILELPTVPCLVRQAEELEQLEIALVENLQRADLNPIEEARAYQKLIDEFSLTQEEVGERVGKKRTTIANALRLLGLPKEIQDALMEKKLSPGHAKIILGQPGDGERLKLFKKILSLNLTVRQAEGEARQVTVKSYRRSTGKDVEIQAKEETLRRALGTKVNINQKGDGGTVTIDYYSAEELNSLVEKLS
ncbi:MAG: ParB/RepB/Spo0J family partition protein [Candidatus Komeilibacteria bacterium]|nr:ParB/RepB/Spo0J family partition protein [Candidatus Komeilibacteria bacterium]